MESFAPGACSGFRRSSKRHCAAKPSCHFDYGALVCFDHAHTDVVFHRHPPCYLHVDGLQVTTLIVSESYHAVERVELLRMRISACSGDCKYGADSYLHKV